MWSDNQNVQITYENITHSGKQMIYLPNGKLILAGKVSSHSDTEEVFQGKEIELTTGAEVLFENDSTLWAPVSMDYDQAKLTIGIGASFTLNSSSIGIYGGTNFILTNQGDLEVTSKLHQAIHLASKSKMNFEAGSSTKANGGDTIEEAVEVTSGSIFVRTGADFVAESKGTQGTLIVGEKIVFEDGANSQLQIIIKMELSWVLTRLQQMLALLRPEESILGIWEIVKQASQIKCTRKQQLLLRCWVIYRV